jgi:hypothetical protein
MPRELTTAPAPLRLRLLCLEVISTDRTDKQTSKSNSGRLLNNATQPYHATSQTSSARGTHTHPATHARAGAGGQQHQGEGEGFQGYRADYAINHAYDREVGQRFYKPHD